MNIKKGILLMIMLTGSLQMIFGQTADKRSGQVKDLAECQAILKDGILTLQNSLISRTYIWNEGDIIGNTITDKATGHIWTLDGKIPDCSFPGTGKPVTSHFQAEQVNATVYQPAYLKAEATVKLGALEVKRVFRIYPGCPAISCSYYLRGKTPASWAAIKNSPGNSTVLERLALPGRNWKVKAIRFFDITDRVNNLVEETSELIYRSDSYLSGNLLYADELTQDRGLFILKEAPTSTVQLAYPGYDFSAKIAEIKAVGVGLDSKELSETQWTPGYGFVTGVTSGGELGRLTALRNYQQNIRTHLPGRDDMILMNTWGDRNQDKSVSEKFTMAELRAAQRLGITHLQIDDGWQTGRSGASAFGGGSLYNIWNNPNYWRPHPEKFPNGLTPVVSLGKELGVEVCLWFNPSQDSSYAHWRNDADVLIGLYRQYGIRTFKIDGVEIPDKKAEINLRKMFDAVMEATSNNAVFNLDVTAGKRYGYHYFNEYGNIFLENRYTDFANYYPHWTLRNLWMLSRYVPAQNLQIEFLNNFRNKDKYPADDVLAPGNIPFEYTFAITMMAQPLAWMEATGLPEEGFKIAPVVKAYQKLQTAIHSGKIFPIGYEPSGSSWTGFQSIQENKGYIIVFRENNNESVRVLKTWLPAGTRVQFKKLIGQGSDFKAKAGSEGEIKFTLSQPNTYALYEYVIR